MAKANAFCQSYKFAHIAGCHLHFLFQQLVQSTADWKYDVWITLLAHFDSLREMILWN